MNTVLKLTSGEIITEHAFKHKNTLIKILPSADYSCKDVAVQGSFIHMRQHSCYT